MRPTTVPLRRAQVPDSLRARRVEVVTRLKGLEAAVKPITEFLSNEDNVKLLKQDKTQNMAFLQKEFGIGACCGQAGGSWLGAAADAGTGALRRACSQAQPAAVAESRPVLCLSFTILTLSHHSAAAAVPCLPCLPARPAGPDQVDALYHFAKWNFECGNYSAAAEYLYHYRTLSTHPERTIASLWGKVAADVLLQVRCRVLAGGREMELCGGLAAAASAAAPYNCTMLCRAACSGLPAPAAAMHQPHAPPACLPACLNLPPCPAPAPAPAPPQEFGSAMDDILKLKEMLVVDTFAPVAKQLQQKAWLMHWSLFVFFNHENGLNALIDLFMQDRWGRPGAGGWVRGWAQAGRQQQLLPPQRRGLWSAGAGILEQGQARHAADPSAWLLSKHLHHMPAPTVSALSRCPALLPRRYLTAIQLTSQHLLRYLAVAVVVNKRRRNVLNDLKRVVSQETYEYR